MKLIKAAAIAGLFLFGSAAQAQVVIGITVSTSGSGAYSGNDHLAAAKLFPETIAGEKVKYVILNDESDPTVATKNARRFVTEYNADLLIGGTLVPACTAVSIVAAETKTPQISLSPIDVPADRFPWVFITAQDSATMARPLFADMRKRGIKSIAYIGYNDAFGEPWIAALKDFAKSAGIEIVADERFARTDASVTGQALKILGSKADAVLIGAAGPSSAMVQVELVNRGYKGVFYHTHGAATPSFLKSGGKAVEGALVTAGPLIVADQLPANAASKTVSEKFLKAYKESAGRDASTFAGYMYDAGLLLEAAIPEALKIAKPGTPEFRKALRDSLERVHGIAGTQGVYSLSERDHHGHDVASLILLKVQDGAFKFAAD